MCRKGGGQLKKNQEEKGIGRNGPISFEKKKKKKKLSHRVQKFGTKKKSEDDHDL